MQFFLKYVDIYKHIVYKKIFVMQVNKHYVMKKIVLLLVITIRAVTDLERQAAERTFSL